MSDNKVDGRYSLLKEVRIIVFKQGDSNSLFVASKVKRNGKEVGEARYNAQLIITDPEEIAAIKAKAAAVARAKWPTVDFKTINFPFISGDKEALKGEAKGKDWSYYKGAMVINGKSKYQPRLSVFQGPGKFQDVTGQVSAVSKFYAGAWVLAQLNFSAYDPVNDGKAGVTAYLDQVSWVKDGTRLLGGQSASEAFKGYQGSVSPEDPTAGASQLDDEIPF
jgi:hypothetical protein